MTLRHADTDIWKTLRASFFFWIFSGGYHHHKNQGFGCHTVVLSYCPPIRMTFVMHIGGPPRGNTFYHPSKPIVWACHLSLILSKEEKTASRFPSIRGTMILFIVIIAGNFGLCLHNMPRLSRLTGITRDSRWKFTLPGSSRTTW